MKKRVLLSLFLSMGFLLTACSGPVSGANTAAEPPETAPESEKTAEGEETTEQPETLVLSINGTVLDVQWEENETVAELLGKENLRSLIHFGQRRFVFSESGS